MGLKRLISRELLPTNLHCERFPPVINLPQLLLEIHFHGAILWTLGFLLSCCLPLASYQLWVQ